ncbi:MAG: CAP domain-containing protein [Cytophagaceae bacterium]|nr:CAP domain-containing protein [Cytophagaceae bacterium]
MKITLQSAAAVLLLGLMTACQTQNDTVPAQETTPVTSSTYAERPESASPPGTLTNAREAAATFSALEEDVLRYVNQARSAPCQCGTQTYPAAPALQLNTLLNTASQKHATDMATYNYFSHTGRDGSLPWDRMRREGYIWRRAAENIAAGYTTARAVVDGWLKSPGHCANIMNANLKDLGVGYAYTSTSRYRYYWVNDFGTR